MSPIACFFYVVVRRTLYSLAVIRPCLLTVIRPCFFGSDEAVSPPAKADSGGKISSDEALLISSNEVISPPAKADSGGKRVVLPRTSKRMVPPQPPKGQLLQGLLRGQVLPGPLRRFLLGSLRRRTPWDKQYCQHTLMSMFCWLLLARTIFLK